MNSDVSDLLISASLDWTIKLWYPKQRNEALLTFESAQEYVYDVQWSPTHPSVFASCDGEGYLDIWDINKDIEAPQVHKKTSNMSINTLKWSLDGKKIAMGDSSGNLSMWNVDKELAIPKNDDVNKLERLIHSNPESSKSGAV